MGLGLRHVAVVVTCWILMLCSVFETSYGSKTRHYKWEVEYMFWSPDCKESIVMGIDQADNYDETSPLYPLFPLPSSHQQKPYVNNFQQKRLIIKEET